MGLLKNGVGRPSNDTLKRRRIIYLVIILVAALGIGTCVFYTVNYFKGTTGTDKNISTSKIYNDISIKNGSGAIYEYGNKTNKGNFKKVSSKTQEIELSSNKASITIRTTYNKDIIKGKLSGVKKYYYQVQIVSYDKNDREISKSKKIDIKKTSIDQTITTGTTVASIKVKFYNATKNHEEIDSKIIYVTAAFDLNRNIKDVTLRKCVLEAYNEAYKTSKATLTKEEIKKITKLECAGRVQKVSNLEGLEYLTELTSLNLNTNNLTSLDVSHNTELTSLAASNNPLKTVNVKKNYKLQTLLVNDTNLTSIYLSGCTILQMLFIDNAKLTSLNVSKNIYLTLLSAGGNKLSKIDLSKNTKLTSLTLRNNKFTKIDVSKNTKLQRLDILQGNNITKANIKVGNNKNLKIS